MADDFDVTWWRLRQPRAMPVVPLRRRHRRRTRPEPAPALKVVSGAKAGRIVALVKSETLIGRTGVQVVALRRTADEVRVVPIEGEHPPSVNGNPVAPEGQPLAAGDILEIAGTRLEVVAAGEGSFGLMSYWMARKVERMMLARQVSGMVRAPVGALGGGGDRSGADRRRRTAAKRHALVARHVAFYCGEQTPFATEPSDCLGFLRCADLKHHKKQMLIICPGSAIRSIITLAHRLLRW